MQNLTFSNAEISTFTSVSTRFCMFKAWNTERGQFSISGNSCHVPQPTCYCSGLCVLCIQKKLSCVERKIPFWPSLNNTILTHGVLSSPYFSDTLASCWKNVPSLNVHWSDDPRLMRTLAKWRLWTGLKPLGKPKVKSKAERDQKIGKPFVHGKELQALQK